MNKKIEINRLTRRIWTPQASGDLKHFYSVVRAVAFVYSAFKLNLMGSGHSVVRTTRA
jgi:hypothetical protein